MEALNISTERLSNKLDSPLKQIIGDLLRSSNKHTNRSTLEFSDYYLDYGDHGYADYLDANYSDYTDR